MKISSFIIALIVVGVFATTFMTGVSELATTHNVSYDNSTFEVYNQAATLNQLAIDLENKSSNQNTESGIVDIVGNYISRAIDTLTLAKQSTTTFNTMTEAAADDIGLPSYFTTAIYSIIIILIVIGIIVSAMVKRDL